jgi:hypothetical protein
MDYEQWLEFQSFARAVMEPRHKVLLEELDKQICAPFSSTIADPLSAFSAAGRWAEKYMFHHHTNTGEKLALEMLHNVSFFALCTANNEANIEGYKLNDEAKGAIWQETRRICTQLAPYLPDPDRAALLALLPAVEDDAPVVADSASNAPAIDPPPVATGNVAHAFDGLRRWNEQAWKKTLGNPPKWLKACIVLPGQRGKREHHWNPVLIGAALVRNGHAKQNNVRARFQTKPQLQAWEEAWKTYEADNFDTQ